MSIKTTKVESNWLVYKITISIKIAESKDRFQVDVLFNNILVTLFIWQFLDQSPQLKILLACAIASSWSSQSGMKSARLNFVGATAMASKSWAPPAIETMVQKDEEVIYLHINVWIGKWKLSKILVDFNTIVELINWKMVYNLDFFIH